MRCSRVVNGLSERRPRLGAGGLLVVALFAQAPPPTAAREVVDATGTRVFVRSDRPSRIVTLAPSLAEIAAEIDPGGLDRIVGVTEYTDRPSALSARTSVGRYDRFNLERVAALKPDLVLATRDGNSSDQVRRLRELGLAVVVTAAGTLADVEESIRLTGQAMGDAESGERLARRFAEEVAALRARAATRGARGTRVLLQVGDDPLVVAGGRSLLHEASALLGLENVYGTLNASYPRPSREEVLRRRPSLILIFDLSGEARAFERMAKRWRDSAALPNARVELVRGDTLTRPVPRMLEGLSELEARLFGAQAVAGGSER
jgi:iron complex transport system substrate-binding protein